MKAIHLILKTRMRTPSSSNLSGFATTMCEHRLKPLKYLLSVTSAWVALHVYSLPDFGFCLTLHNYSFASFKYFFNRVEDSENIERDLSESSTRLKKYKKLAKL